MKICNCSIDHVRADPLRIAIALHCIESKGSWKAWLHFQHFILNLSRAVPVSPPAWTRCNAVSSPSALRKSPTYHALRARIWCPVYVHGRLHNRFTTEGTHPRSPWEGLRSTGPFVPIRPGGPPFQLSVQKGTNRVVIGAVADTSRVWTHVSRQLAAAFAHLCVASRLLER